MKKLLSLLVLSVILTLTIDLFAQTVYTNKADSKFHLLTCKYLDPSHDSLDMAFAVKKGFGACPICKPSAQGASSSGSMGSMGAPKSMEKSGMGQQGNATEKVASQQCIVIDKDGKRCSGMKEPGSVYCLEHRNYKK